MNSDNTDKPIDWRKVAEMLTDSLNEALERENQLTALNRDLEEQVRESRKALGEGIAQLQGNRNSVERLQNAILLIATLLPRVGATNLILQREMESAIRSVLIDAQM
jgi:archaellum component FlaC